MWRTTLNGGLTALLVILAMLAPLAGANAQSAEPGTAAKPAPAVKILTIERQPFAMQQGGKLVGFSVELWQEVAKELGVRSDFEVVTSFGDMLKGVATSRADAAIANITITSKREKILDSRNRCSMPASRSWSTRTALPPACSVPCSTGRCSASSCSPVSCCSSSPI